MIRGLGIGTATAVFTAFRAVMLEELPVTDPDRLVSLSLERPSAGEVPLVPEELDALRRESRTLADVAGVARSGAVAVPLTEGERSLVLDASRVTANFFQVLGARPVLGRLLRPEDGEEGAARVTVISHETWRREFGADPDVLGRRLTQTRYQESYTIVGVAPPGLDHPIGADYWIPTGSRRAVDIVARLAPGVTPKGARAEVLSIGRSLVAGLLVRSFQRLAELELGYDADGVAVVELGINREGREGPEETFTLLDGVLERMRGVAGVSAGSSAISTRASTSGGPAPCAITCPEDLWPSPACPRCSSLDSGWRRCCSRRSDSTGSWPWRSGSGPTSWGSGRRSGLLQPDFGRLSSAMPSS